MTGFEAYKLYLSLKRHFTPGSDYNFIKYNGKTSASVMSYENRKDKMFYLKLAKHRDAQGFLVANFAKNHKSWIGQLAYSAEAEAVYVDREKRLLSMAYTTAQEASDAADGQDFNTLLTSVDGVHPPLLQAYIREDVSLETLIALDEIVKFTNSWTKTIGWDPVVSQVIEKIAKTKAFTPFDAVSVKNAVMKKFS
jgi:hypothetical protein